MRLIKKLLAIVVVMVFVLTPMTMSANDTITVTINGEVVEFEDQAPVIIGNRTLVPIRFVFQDLGFYVGWDRNTQTATLSRDDYIVVIPIGSDTFTVNGVSRELDVPAQLIGGRTMIPLYAVLASIGYEVTWVRETRTVAIVTRTTDETLPPIYVSEWMLSVLSGGEILQYISASERIDEIRALAYSGDALGQYLLGLIYRGNPYWDPYYAMELFRMSADQGLARAIAQVGINYVFGSGVEADIPQGVYWLNSSRNGECLCPAESRVAVYARGRCPARL